MELLNHLIIKIMTTNKIWLGILIIAVLFGGYVFLSDNGGTGGSTSDNWNVGGNLSVTGTTAFTSAVTGSSMTLSGAADVGAFTQGGGCTATTTVSATDTWTEAELLANNCFVYSGTVAAAITITTPATSTMTTLLPNVGDTREWLYDATAYAAATTTTFAAGTGGILYEPNTGDDFNVVIAGGQSALIKAWRMNDTDVAWLVTELSDAD